MVVWQLPCQSRSLPGSHVTGAPTPQGAGASFFVAFPAAPGLLLDVAEGAVRSVHHVPPNHPDSPAVRGRRQSRGGDYLAIALVGLVDGPVVDLFHGDAGLARIPQERYVGAVERRRI